MAEAGVLCDYGSDLYVYCGFKAAFRTGCGRRADSGISDVSSGVRDRLCGCKKNRGTESNKLNI